MNRTARIRTRFRDGRSCYRVDRDGCWIWRGAKNDRGYPQIGVGGRTVYAHRHYYTTLVGPIPPGLQLDHLCRKRLCVNPEHLEAVTQRENIRRGSNTKLRADQVRYIRHAVGLGIRQARLASSFGVHSSTISRIVAGQLWIGV